MFFTNSFIGVAWQATKYAHCLGWSALGAGHVIITEE
jgi:hypothetical protein